MAILNFMSKFALVQQERKLLFQIQSTAISADSNILDFYSGRGWSLLFFLWLFWVLSKLRYNWSGDIYEGPRLQPICRRDGPSQVSRDIFRGSAISTCLVGKADTLLSKHLSICNIFDQNKSFKEFVRERSVKRKFVRWKLYYTKWKLIKSELKRQPKQKQSVFGIHPGFPANFEG